jgi:hypothetical protein
MDVKAQSWIFCCLQVFRLNERSGLGFSIDVGLIFYHRHMQHRDAALAQCAHRDGTEIHATFPRPGDASAPPHRSLLLIPGGSAQLSGEDQCTVLTFTGIRDRQVLYTGDGIGRGLSVAITPDHKLIITHATGWTAKSL